MCFCLTERTFIHETEDKYDLESKLTVYPKIVTELLHKMWEKN